MNAKVVQVGEILTFTGLATSCLGVATSLVGTVLPSPNKEMLPDNADANPDAGTEPEAVSID